MRQTMPVLSSSMTKSPDAVFVILPLARRREKAALRCRSFLPEQSALAVPFDNRPVGIGVEALVVRIARQFHPPRFRAQHDVYPCRRHGQRRIDGGRERM